MSGNVGSETGDSGSGEGEGEGEGEGDDSCSGSITGSGTGFFRRLLGFLAGAGAVNVGMIKKVNPSLRRSAYTR